MSTSHEDAPDGILPPRTAEQQARVLQNLAVSEAERRLREGTAPTSLVLYYLRQTEADYEAQIEKLSLENELLRARTEKERAAVRGEELYQEAIKAFKTYAGHEEEEIEDEY